ncbi:hypothetical protein [Myroides odoratus]
MGAKEQRDNQTIAAFGSSYCAREQKVWKGIHVGMVASGSFEEPQF